MFIFGSLVICVSAMEVKKRFRSFSKICREERVKSVPIVNKEYQLERSCSSARGFIVTSWDEVKVKYPDTCADYVDDDDDDDAVVESVDLQTKLIAKKNVRDLLGSILSYNVCVDFFPGQRTISSRHSDHTNPVEMDIIVIREV